MFIRVFRGLFPVNVARCPLTLSLIRLYALSMWTCASTIAVLIGLGPKSGGLVNVRSMALSDKDRNN